MFWVGQAFADDVDLKKARELIDGGKSAEAYSMLAPQEELLSGDQDFDYLLALAALDSGQLEKSITIFDRILAVNPKFAGARVDLARAYFALGSLDLARQEFDTVQHQNPPQGVLDGIKKYMDLIEERTRPKKNSLTAYAEASLGHDSNMNAANSLSQINFPALGTLITMDNANLSTPSPYMALSSGLELTHHLEPGVNFLVGLDLKKKDAPDASSFNTASADGHLGVQLSGGADVYTFSAQQGRFYLGGLPNRDTTGFSAQWQHTINPTNQLVVFGTENKMRFVPETSKNQNMDQSIVGSSLIHSFDTEGKFVASPTLLAGKERSLSGRADGDKIFAGARLAFQYRLRDSLTGFASGGAQYGQYMLENTGFLTTRLDRQYDATVGVQWKINNAWSVKSQVSHTANDTNIVIYKYDRTDLSLAIRWDFR